MGRRPTDAQTDAERIGAEVQAHRAALDILAARPDVDQSRIALVGHDFGAMHGTLLAADDARIAATVLIAATPRWGDWFLPSGRSPAIATTTFARSRRSTPSAVSRTSARAPSASSSRAATSSSRP